MTPIYEISSRKPVFETSGYHYEYQYVGQSSYHTIDENEETELLNFCHNVCNNKIQSGDTLYFDRSEFPKLVLNLLDTGVKRTIKREKSSKIVECSKYIPSYDKLEFGYIIGKCDYSHAVTYYFLSDSSVTESSLDLDQMKQIFSGDWRRAVRAKESVSMDLYNCIKDYSEKIVLDSSVTEYLNSVLPKLSEEEISTILSLCKSSDLEHQKLAINLLVQSNLSDILFDVVNAFCSSKTPLDSSVKSSVKFKYLNSILGGNLSKITARNFWKRNSYFAILSAYLFNSSLINSAQKAKAWKSFAKYYTDSTTIDPNTISTYAKRAFEGYNMPFKYDPNRETA